MELGLVVIVLFLVLHPLLGIRRSDLKSDIGSMVVADGHVSPFRAGASLLATILGASAVMGTSGLAYTHGWVALAWLWAGVLGLLLLALLLPRVRFGHAMTLPHLLGDAGRPVLRKVAAALIVPAWLGIVAAQLAAVHRICGTLAPGAELPLVVLAAVTIAAYVAMSGQRGVLRTDWMQLSIIAAFLLSILGYLLLREAEPAQPVPAMVPMPLGRVVDVVFLVAFPFLVGPDMFSRLLLVDGTRGRRQALLMAAGGLAVFAVIITAIGVLGHYAFPGLTGEKILLEIPAAWGKWAALLAGLGLLATVLSSADTCALSASSILAIDLLGRQSVTLVRVSAVAITALALALALWLGGIIPSLMWTYTLYTTGLAVPAIAALFLHRPLAPTSLILSMASGATVGILGLIYKFPYSLPLALTASLLAALTTNLLTPTKSERSQ